jgi:hypothetical protein
VLVATTLADDPQRGHFAQSEYWNGAAIERVLADYADRLANQVAQETALSHDLSLARFYQVFQIFL